MAGGGWGLAGVGGGESEAVTAKQRLTLNKQPFLLWVAVLETVANANDFGHLGPRFHRAYRPLLVAACFFSGSSFLFQTILTFPFSLRNSMFHFQLCVCNCAFGIPRSS